MGFYGPKALFMVKLLCPGLFIRWDKADKDGGPLQQGQAAWTWGSVTWHTHGISDSRSAPLTKTPSPSREWHSIVQYQAQLSGPITDPDVCSWCWLGLNNVSSQVHLHLMENICAIFMPSLTCAKIHLKNLGFFSFKYVIVTDGSWLCIFFYFVFLSVEQVICKILQFILLTHLGKVMKYTLDRYKDRHQSIPGHRHHLFLQSLQGAILGSLIDLNMHVLDRGRTRVHGKDPCRPERTCKFHRERPFGNSTKGNGLNPQLKPDNICYELAF